jgi:glycosyltransferase involved in cell wall biosynthesis
MRMGSRRLAVRHREADRCIGYQEHVRIATVIAKLEPGGAQLSALRKALALRAHGIDLHVIAAEASTAGIGLFDAHGIGVEVWGRCSGMQYACRADFADWLRPRLARAELVHAHMFGAWWAAARAAPPGVPLAATEHNALQWPGRARRAEMREALRRIDLFYAHGPTARAQVLEAGMEPWRVRDGLSPVPFEGALAPDAETASRRVVFAGRLDREKGPDVLVEALGLMDHPPPAVLLGAGPEEDALRRRVAQLGLTERVSFPGWQDDAGAWLAGAGACVVPSRHDAWSQAAVLAMGLRVPVVASAVEGLPLLLARRRGIAVPAEDPQALAGALEAVLAGRLRPDLEAARAYAVAHSPERVARVYAADYAELLERRAVAQPIAA